MSSIHSNSSSTRGTASLARAPSALAASDTLNPDHEKCVWGMTTSTWIQVIAVVSLGVLLYWPNLRRLWEKTNPFYGEPNWGHAIFVPLIGLFYLYLHRDELKATRNEPAWSGLPILIGGILISVYGIWPGQNDFVKDMGMVVSIFGIVTLLCGWQVMKIVWFPIVFLVCALPWPGLVYSWIAGPLQRLAALVAVGVLQLSNVEASSSGTKILIQGQNGVRTLNVAEACAGLRSLMTFVSVAAAIAFLSPRALWQRLTLVFSAIPIAVCCNSMRVAGQGLLDHYVSTAFSEGFAHSFVGLVMLIPAFFLILLMTYILDHLFIEVRDPGKRALNGEKSFPVSTAAAKSSGGGALPRPVTAAIPRVAASSGSRSLRSKPPGANA